MDKINLELAIFEEFATAAAVLQTVPKRYSSLHNHYFLSTAERNGANIDLKKKRFRQKMSGINSALHAEKIKNW